MSNAGTQVLDDEAIGTSSYVKALLNILDDHTIEREWQDNSQNAILNIFDDIATEKLQLEDTQHALLNILEDLDVERIRVGEVNVNLQAVNKAMQDFIGIASHDLRSPLASIMGYSTTLSENWDDFSEEDRRNTTATIVRQSQNLSRLVDDLFTLSSVESGGLSAVPEEIVLREAIDRCLDAGGWDTTSVWVSCSLDLVVVVDPRHLGRILGNYVQNAFKYGEPPVRVEATQVGGVVQIRVVDHGPGVPPEFVSKLFVKFARANTSSTKAKKGAGLGLSIVRALAEVNGGQTSYEPNTPSGGCFVVCLPACERPN